MMANRFPYKDPHSLQPANMIQPNVPGFSGRTIWPQQQIQQQQHQQQIDEQKQREYWKQQQKLKLMSGSLHKQPVSADKLIENLLEKKDTFRPKVNPQPVPSAQVSSHLIQNIQGHPVGNSINLGYPQMHPGYPTMPVAHHPAAAPLADVDLAHGYSKRLSQIPNDITVSKGFSELKTVHPEISINKTQSQFPAWLSSSSPNLPALYRQVWMYAGNDKGFVDTTKIFPILLTSGLPTDVLGYIWGIANQKVAGQLTEEELYIVLALVALAQAGCAFNNVGILNIIPQPPIPNLNVNVVGTGALPHSGMIDSKVQDEVLNTQMKSDINQDPIDEFTDFQSAVLDTSSTAVTSSSASTVKENVPPLDNSFLTDSKSASSVPDQKFPSVVVMGNTGRGIGSRLANHSLGMPRQVKTRHHKHHHHHHHHHHRSHHSAAISIDDEFSDFQQAKDPGSEDTPDSVEIFAKCIPKPVQSKTFVLKESAIRTEEDTGENRQLFITKADLNEPMKVVEAEVSDPVKQVLEEKVSSRNSKELMSVEEDKYSALRALSFAGVGSSTKKSIDEVDGDAADDFGDFLSAELPPTTNSFVQSPAGHGTIWSATSNVEFKAEDWGAFESAETPQIATGGWALNMDKQLISSESKPEDVLSKNNLDIVDDSFSWDLNLAPMQKTEVTDDLKFSDVSTTSNVNDNDSWNLQLGEETVAKVNGVSLLGKIYDSAGQNSDKVDLFSSVNEPSAESNLFVIEDKGDDFGEFMGPETWSTDGKSSKDVLFDPPSASGIKESAYDNQSVSSLELPPLALSRHGSLPSLDLKIFPQNGEKSNGHQAWDTSSQGPEHQIQEWCRCVQSCLEVLQAAHKTFSSISSDEVLQDVLHAQKGRNYLYNLLEVYGICQRVRHSANHVIADSKQLENLLTGVDSSWIDLEQFYAIAEITTDLEFVLENHESSENREHSVCGICLNSIGSDLMESDINSYHLEYGGQVYHAACANLWVNCVDCSLPSLTLL